MCDDANVNIQKARDKSLSEIGKRAVVVLNVLGLLELKCADDGGCTNASLSETNSSTSPSSEPRRALFVILVLLRVKQMKLLCFPMIRKERIIDNEKFHEQNILELRSGDPSQANHDDCHLIVLVSISKMVTVYTTQLQQNLRCSKN